MSFDFWIDKIAFNDGTTIEVKRNEIVIIVGSNNAGKSQALRDIQDAANHSDAPRIVVKEVSEHREGTEQEFKSFLFDNFAFSNKGAVVQVSNLVGFSSHGFDFSWGSHRSHTAGRFLVNRLDIEQRLAASKPATQYDPIETLPTHPLHRLYKDDALLKKLDNWFYQAFRERIALDLRGGSNVPLYAGAIPELKSGELPTDTSYISRLRAEASPLHMQGDGMRAFVGVLLNTLLLEFKVHLIDEPEAFLHPPQARLLGELLCRNNREGTQLFMSTHSGDFLRGVLRSERANLRIVRIRREGKVNRTSTLAPRAIRGLWNDPVLLYSNVLDGIFHEKVVICESWPDGFFVPAS